mmetsp:Transcript_99219/g.167258  ORF Transcript_99219/g.167258 Transcript_99219/m.167258 type:complete len:86 (+) Transcript_99219:562-819(+)
MPSIGSCISRQQCFGVHHKTFLGTKGRPHWTKGHCGLDHLAIQTTQPGYQGLHHLKMGGLGPPHPVGRSARKSNNAENGLSVEKK